MVGYAAANIPSFLEYGVYPIDSAQIESILGEFRRNVNVIQATGIAQLFGSGHFPSFLGRSLAMMCGMTSAQDTVMTKYLSEFPTETTLGERKLLYNFFVNFWDGKDHVLEVGPFLGGTSRAIALGMLHSSNRQDEVKLFTYDKFRDYYQPQQLLESLAPMFEAGILNDEVRGVIKESSSFKEVYELLHSGQDYSDLIVAQTGVLPDDPTEKIAAEDAFALPEDRSYSAVFIDGAKSWYGTKSFMSQAAAHTQPGGFYIFQDYGAHTCFWIPVFLELMKDYFQLLANVDHTYVYQQVKEMSAQDIEKVFPDSPLEFTVEDYQKIFRNLYSTALDNDNTYTLPNYQLQHAAALGYIGQLELARDRIIDLLKTPHALRYRQWILNALNIPTFTPDGNVNLF